MKNLPLLFENNRQWASQITEKDPFFFSRLAQQQTPEFLWIGCSDSRVPANEIVGLLPGELFVHRNVANLVVHSDMNCLSVLQYALEVLNVRHIIVCGHYGCGGVKATFESQTHGLVDNWLRPIREIQQRRSGDLRRFSTLEERVDRLCELNVIEQVKNVGNTPMVQEAWQKGREVTLHGWIYAISNGRLKDLDACVSSVEDLARLEEL